MQLQSTIKGWQINSVHSFTTRSNQFQCLMLNQRYYFFSLYLPLGNSHAFQLPSSLPANSRDSGEQWPTARCAFWEPMQRRHLVNVIELVHRYRTKNPRIAEIVVCEGTIRQSWQKVTRLILGCHGIRVIMLSSTWMLRCRRNRPNRLEA